MTKTNKWTRRGALAAFFTIMTSGPVSARRGSTPPVNTGPPGDIPGRGKGPSQRGPPDDVPGKGKGRRHRDPPQEYADPSALELESVKHQGAEPFTEHDEITFRNTDGQLPLPVGGWTVDVSPNQEPVVISEGTVIEPGFVLGIVLDAEDKVLERSGGVIYVYDDEGNEVGNWNYVGSPNDPYMSPDETTDPNEIDP